MSTSGGHSHSGRGRTGSKHPNLCGLNQILSSSFGSMTAAACWETKRRPCLQYTNLLLNLVEWQIPLPPDVRNYWKKRQILSLAGDLLLKGQRIVIPSLLIEKMLNILNQDCRGIIKCQARAWHWVWWPGLSANISQKVANCSLCTKQRTTQKCGDRHIQLEQEYLPISTFHQLTQSYQLWRTSLVGIGSQSCWCQTPANCMPVLFSKTLPESMDSVIQNNSPIYSQANGEAEQAVATVKGLWKEGGDH